MIENEEKNCGNCKYFVSYYIKEKTRFRCTLTGYCHFERSLIKSKKKLLAFTPACELWESNEDLKKDKKQDIEKAIINMANQLNEIVNLLKE